MSSYRGSLLGSVLKEVKRIVNISWLITETIVLGGFILFVLFCSLTFAKYVYAVYLTATNNQEAISTWEEYQMQVHDSRDFNHPEKVKPSFKFFFPLSLFGAVCSLYFIHA